ncbi:MAG TPA: Crp/Fnr family transcriptional regulator [Terriglobales bacterium]
MPFREAVGLSYGSHSQVPDAVISGLPISRPVPSGSSAFVKPLVRKRTQADSQYARPNPLYLFYCSVQWHKSAETSAGWELIQAMRSENPGARALAAELLSETEDARLLVRDLRRTRKALNLIAAAEPKTSTNAIAPEGKAMSMPYGLPMIENCTCCSLKKDGWFCHLSNELLHSFSASSHLATYPSGAILFVEGQVPRGGFLLCSGKVKLSTTSKEGKVLVLKIVEPGEIMGLSAVISGEPYAITAETLEPCLVNCVDRDGLLRLMERSGELGLRSAQAVSREFQYAYREIHELVLARSSSGKLARLLLSWAESSGPRERELRIQTPATHEEMAQRIGASRETVTRLISELKKKNLIRLDGATLVIKNRTALETMAM